MFEKYIVAVNENPAPKKIDNVSMNIENNPMINRDILKQTLYNFDNYTDDYLINIIRYNIDILLTDVFNKDGSNNYLNLITNKRFLSIFIKSISVLKINEGQRIKCNKLAYDYLTLKNNDQDIKTLFFSLSKVVNRDIIPILLSIGIPEELASYMGLSRYSSEKEIINVKRLNFIMMTSNSDLMTVQRIVYIYEKLFDRLIPLFEGIMFEGTNIDDDYVTDEMSLIYSNISLAILEIVNNIPSEMIISLLKSYNLAYNIHFGRIQPRFSLNSISDDYKRILNCIDILREENIII